jgi:hypothetical protein
MFISEIEYGCQQRGPVFSPEYSVCPESTLAESNEPGSVAENLKMNLKSEYSLALSSRACQEQNSPMLRVRWVAKNATPTRFASIHGSSKRSTENVLSKICAIADPDGRHSIR